MDFSERTWGLHASCQVADLYQAFPGARVVSCCVTWPAIIVLGLM